MALASAGTPTLPATDREVKYSTRRFRHYQPADGSDCDAVVPDIEVLPTRDAYPQGIDPARDGVYSLRSNTIAVIAESSLTTVISGETTVHRVHRIR